MDCMSIYIQIKRLREVFINIMYIHRRNSQCLKSREKCEEFNVSLMCLQINEEAQFLHNTSIQQLFQIVPPDICENLL